MLCCLPAVHTQAEHTLVVPGVTERLFQFFSLRALGLGDGNAPLGPSVLTALHVCSLMIKPLPTIVARLKTDRS